MQEVGTILHPGTLVMTTIFLCLSADAQHLAAYTHYDPCKTKLLKVSLNLSIAWGWLIFTINSLMTGAITGKIIVAPVRMPTVATPL
ncbi:hypothetical protein C8Q80DRAFT_1146434 [Daedaleopsis nitida]|nr:hypothetical protein C8Q80DRAFT_1146434 [Daedaleopsis nitida]